MKKMINNISIALILLLSYSCTNDDQMFQKMRFYIEGNTGKRYYRSQYRGIRNQHTNICKSSKTCK